MRLLDVLDETPSSPQEIAGAPPPFAIVSHTWSADEVTFRDLQDPERAQSRHGWQKLQSVRKLARNDGYRFIWMDTCCIEKSSSTELSEAINSMYQWYQTAAVCYVYLDDMDGFPPIHGVRGEAYAKILRESRFNALSGCRWFKRGWTLQELIAPRRVVFFDRLWKVAGDLSLLSETVSDITTIDISLLAELPEHRDKHAGARLASFSIAQRMSWAAGRETTRVEDRAYSLLGLLDVNLDIRYGEGPKAFIRLQEELIQRSTDQSIFAWPSTRNPFQGYGAVLAPSPDAFKLAGMTVGLPSKSYRMSNHGLHLVAPCTRNGVRTLQVWLRCKLVEDPSRAIVLNVNVDEEGVRMLDSSADANFSMSDEITCAVSAEARIQFVDIERMTAQARPFHLVIARKSTTGFKSFDQRKQSTFVWLRFPERKVPALNLVDASPLPTQATTNIWRLKSDPTGHLNYIVMALALDEQRVADLQLVLSWRLDRGYSASAEFTPDLSTDLSAARDALKAHDRPLSPLTEPVEARINVDGARQLKAVIKLLSANEEMMFVLDVSHERSIRLTSRRRSSSFKTVRSKKAALLSGNDTGHEGKSEE